MGKGRLEAFSDGVIAIIITIMVLDFKRPDDLSLDALALIAPHIGVYALSFIYVGIYWNNHHHMFHAVKGVTGAILWANMHLLFWLSLVPFTSSWMAEHYRAAVPVALYGFVLVMAALAYLILEHLLVRHEGPDSLMAKAVGRDFKAYLSPVAYGTAIVLSFFYPLASLAIYAGVALSWLVPDPRIERAIKTS